MHTQFCCGSHLPTAVTAQKLWCRSLRTAAVLSRSLTAQTWSLKRCQDLVLFRIRNTEPQKTVKSNRGWLSSVTGGYTDGSQVWNCQTPGGIAAPTENKGTCCSELHAVLFQQSSWRRQYDGYHVSNPLQQSSLDQPYFWCPKKGFVCSQSHLADECCASASSQQTS